MTNNENHQPRVCVATQTQEFLNIKSLLIDKGPILYNFKHAENKLRVLLDHLNRNEYDVLILDIEFFDEAELLESLKKCAALLPTITISSKEPEYFTQKMIEAGVQEHFHTKRLSTDVLCQTIPSAILRHTFIKNQQRAFASKLKLQSDVTNLTELCIDGMLVVNSDKIIQFANHAASVLLQKTNEKLVGQAFEYPIAPDHATEITLLHPENQQGFAEMRATPIVWNGEQAWLASLRDVTARKQFEDELQQQAIHDSLTNLFTRKTFFTFLQEEHARSRRYHHSFSLLILDIDCFKQVNTKHGEQAGDLILRSLSNLLIAETRTIDRVCRYSGEKFTIILPQTDAAGAMTIAERLCITTEASVFKINMQPVSITFSIGVATYPSNADSTKVLIAAAESALYAAKKSGRNCVCRHSIDNPLAEQGI